jgi:hypothetical protein
MSNDVFKEVSEESQFNLGISFSGIILGIILIIIASVLIFWNESKYIKNLNSLKKGQSMVIKVNPEQPVNTANEGKLVFLQGTVKSDELIVDPMFEVSKESMVLSRKVQMYQWKERKTQTKNHETNKIYTKYEYVKTWSGSNINSSFFKYSKNHKNPNFPFKSEDFYAEDVKIGQYRLGNSLIHKIIADKQLTLNDIKIPTKYKIKSHIKDNEIYIGNNPENPEIGDIRINYLYNDSDIVTIVAEQNKGKLVPYSFENSNLEILRYGKHSLEDIFEAEKKSSKSSVWIVRIVGWVLMTIAFALLVNPLISIISFIPGGDAISSGIAFATFIFGTIFTLFIISLAWITHKPVVSLFLFGIIVVLITIPILKKKVGSI